MLTRRHALKTLAWTSGALALTPHTLLSQNAAGPAEAEGVFKLPPLGYDYDALEPFIDAETMKLHHDKHHAAYVSKLNQAIAKAPGLEKLSLEEMLAKVDQLPEEVRKDVRNQGGGHANHTLLWQILKKNEKGQPTGELAKAIDSTFGSFSTFQEQFADASMKLFGSGWVWLVWRQKKLGLESTPNQDSPLMSEGIPLMGIDLWEHAYYLKHQNRRAEYLQAFANVLNWDFITERFSKLS